MDPKELRGLMEAYAKVHAPIEELYKGKHGQTETEYQDSRSHAGKMISGDSKQSGAAWSHRSYKGVGKPAKPGERQANQGRMDSGTKTDLEYRKANLKKEEVEQVDEASYSAKAARAGKDIGKPGKAFAKIAKEAGERYGSKERGEKVAGAVLAKLRKQHEEVEQVDENRYAMRNPEEYERMQRKPKQKSERERRMNDPHIGINSPAFQQFMKQQMGGSGGKKKTNEEVDVFDVVLEFLQAEGYAETLEEAQWIMANELDAEDIDAILDEAYVDYRRGKLPSGRTPQQATHDREDALKARQKRDETLGKGSNPETYNQRGRIARQSETRSQMDRTTTLGARFGGKMSRGEPSLGRHQRAIDRRSAIQGAQDADKKTRG